jgi:predicted transcriptional regulator
MNTKTKEIEFFDRERIWKILRKQEPKLIQEKSDRFFNGRERKFARPDTYPGI